MRFYPTLETLQVHWYIQYPKSDMVCYGLEIAMLSSLKLCNLQTKSCIAKCNFAAIYGLLCL